MSENLEVHVQLGQATHRIGTLYYHLRGRLESSTYCNLFSIASRTPACATMLERRGRSSSNFPLGYAPDTQTHDILWREASPRGDLETAVA